MANFFGKVREAAIEEIDEIKVAIEERTSKENVILFKIVEDAFEEDMLERLGYTLCLYKINPSCAMPTCIVAVAPTKAGKAIDGKDRLHFDGYPVVTLDELLKWDRQAVLKLYPTIA